MRIAHRRCRDLSRQTLSVLYKSRAVAQQWKDERNNGSALSRLTFPPLLRTLKTPTLRILIAWCRRQAPSYNFGGEARQTVRKETAGLLLEATQHPARACRLFRSLQDLRNIARPD